MYDEKVNIGPPRLVIFDIGDQPIATFKMDSVTVEWDLNGDLRTIFRPEPTQEPAKRDGHIGMCLLITPGGINPISISFTQKYIEKGDIITIEEIVSYT